MDTTALMHHYLDVLLSLLILKIRNIILNNAVMFVFTGFHTCYRYSELIMKLEGFCPFLSRFARRFERWAVRSGNYRVARIRSRSLMFS